MSPKLFSGPIVFPSPGPTLAREVAAAEREVTKSNSVVESKRVITIKLSISIKCLFMNSSNLDLLQTIYSPAEVITNLIFVKQLNNLHKY